jgi:membrane protease YdiL (CAAX protease family)
MDKSQSRALSFKVFGLLLFGAILGVVAILPYSLTLTPLPPAYQAQLGLVLISSIIQNAIIFGVATALGLWIGGKVGLGAPMLRDWLAGNPEAPRAFRAGLPLAVVLGVVSSVLVVVLDVVVFQPLMPATTAASPSQLIPPAWMGLLASFYGGIDEELLLRLFLMSLLVWIGCKLTRTATPGAVVAWTANILAAILFGAGHLPATAAVFPLTAVVITRALLLNGLIGVATGWLYWRRGILLAIAAHFSADLVLHVLLPLIGPLLGAK